MIKRTNTCKQASIHRFRHSQLDVEITGLSSSRVSTLEDACEDSYTPTTKTTSGGRNYILASRQVHRFRHSQFGVEITGLSSSRVEDAVTRPQPKLRPAVGTTECIILASRQVHRFRHSQFVVEITGLSSSRVSTLEDACEDSYTPTTKITSGGRSHRVFSTAKELQILSTI